MTMGLRIKRARRAADLTQEVLAARIGVSHSTIARWEADGREPARAQVRAIAMATGVSAGWLEFGSEDEAALGPERARHPQRALAETQETRPKPRSGERIMAKTKPGLEMSGESVIAFQGLPGAYSHLACREAYPAMTPLPCPSFEDAFQAVEDGRAKLAMIPIENSLGGRVADIHTLLPDSNLYIIGEHFQPVHHNLLAVKGATLEGLKSARSHVQALAQCRETLRELGLKAVTTPDTAGAAEEISRLGDPTVAAVASSLAAETYGLEILRSRIEDRIGNVTRFVVMSRRRVEPDPADGPCLTSFVFTVRSVPAALYKSLGGFATNGVNLIKLESYISVGDYSVARFYGECQGHPAEKHVDRAFEELQFFTTKVKILGVYPQSPFRLED